jgi:ATP-dependent DNA helicase RecG
LKLSEQLDSRIRQRIPFVLTPAQEKVIAEIKEDLVKPYPMNRLLQGDVGSGKTIVAVYAILAAIGNHTQAAFMAPTEILAEQHYQTVSRILENSQVRIVLLTSGIKKKERLEKLELIRKGEIDLVIGTHALIQKDVVFNKLALLIIDEQHKFGVEQRETLRAKGENPHTIVMTATPIPQTLTFTIFGDLDLSVIDQLPPGRKPVKTILRSSDKLAEAFAFIRQKIHEGRQVYFVYPLIYEQKARGEEQKENKKVLKSATQMAKQLKAQVFPEYNIKLLHGEMSQKKKDETMRDFRAGKISILVSTVVIEVGIDVPNACVMVIDHAERYGLAQLHQLRGRIGRGEHNSYCLLFGDVTTPESEKRLKIMEETNDGFRIAEEDLRIRGPGEFLGKRQSGFPEFKIADLSRDLEILKKVRQSAFTIIKDDPQLTNHSYLKQLIKIGK